MPCFVLSFDILGYKIHGTWAIERNARYYAAAPYQDAEDMMVTVRRLSEGGLPEDCEIAIARLKLPLSVYGGVELAVYTTDDQITLSPGLELFVYARSDRWLYILLGKGLVEQDRITGTRWDEDAPLSDAPELETAIELTVERLGLEIVPGTTAERDDA